MQQAYAVAAVAAGGALGSTLRYFVSRWFIERTGGAFPWGTFVINVSGSFAIGIVLQLALARSGMNPYVRLFLATGILGGYTTFSTYAYDIVALGGAAQFLPAAGYAFGSVVAGIGAAYVGTSVVRLLAA